MPLPDTGREVLAALLDHPDNPSAPVPWRIDNELGVGPSPSAAGAWTLAEDGTTTFRYRLAVFDGPVSSGVIDDEWHRFTEEVR
jgi:hypothetical protein